MSAPDSGACGGMLAVTFHGTRSLRLSTVPRPQILQPTDAIVKVIVASICGSDIHPYAGRERGLDEGTIFGHEFVGRVHALGSAVTTLSLGDRVASPFTTCCGACWYCSHQLPCRCSSGQLFGWLEGGAGLHGAQAEYVRVPLAGSTLVRVPEGVTDREALLLGDVLPTGWFCAQRADIGALASQDPGHAVCAAVIGCGPVGLMAVLAARAQGARRVLALDTVPERLALAERFGGEPVLADDPAKALSAVREASGGRGADCVLEAVGSQAAIRLACDLLRPGGTISSVGVHTEATFSFTPVDGYNKNLTYRNGRCPARHFMPELLQLVRAGQWGQPFLGTQIFTHCVRLQDEKDVLQAYKKFEQKQDGCIKVLIQCE